MPGCFEVATPSRFLQSLPEEDVEFERPSADLAKAPSASRAPEDFADWEEGELVRHPEHGLGMVQWIQRSPDVTRAAVRFAAYGERTFILEYAELERVDVDDLESEDEVVVAEGDDDDDEVFADDDE